MLYTLAAVSVFASFFFSLDQSKQALVINTVDHNWKPAS